MFHTQGHGQVEITREIRACLEAHQPGDGLLTLFGRHTSASLLIQENAAPEVQADLQRFFETLAPEDPTRYRHEDEGPDDMPAHLRAAAFYLLYAAGLVWFAVLPHVSEGWTFGLLNGAILGLVAYGTYDLTCAAILKTWSIPVTVVDMVWGALASGLAGAAGVLATRHFGG